MEDLLIDILSDSFGYPVIRQGSMQEDEKYPNHFFTFWNRSSDADAFYDNDEHQINIIYDLNFYSIDPNKTYNILYEAKTLLKKNGFKCFGSGRDLESDEKTHTGRTINLTYIKQL